MIFNLKSCKNQCLSKVKEVKSIKHMAAISNTGSTFPGFLECFFLKRTQSNGCELPKSWAGQPGKHFKVLYSTFHIQRSPTHG